MWSDQCVCEQRGAVIARPEAGLGMCRLSSSCHCSEMIIIGSVVRFSRLSTDSKFGWVHFLYYSSLFSVRSPAPPLRCFPACRESCDPPSLWEPGPGWPQADSAATRRPPQCWCSGATWARIRSRSPWNRSTRPAEPRSSSIASTRPSAPVCCESCTGSSP